MRQPQIIPALRHRHPGWLNVHTGRFFPMIAGAEEPTAEEKAAAEKAVADAAAATAAAEKAAADAAKAAEDQLGDAGKAAIAAERERAKKAEKDLKAAQTRLKEIEDASLSETEKLKKEADEGKAALATANGKLQKANLISALAEKGLTGAKGKAAAKLLEGVEYDDDDEPTNLDDVIKTAATEYGDEMFKGAVPKPKPPGSLGGGAGAEGEKPALTAEELAVAKEFGMTGEDYQVFKDTQPKIPEPAKT